MATAADYRIWAEECFVWARTAHDERVRERHYSSQRSHRDRRKAHARHALDGTGQQENCADDKYMGRQLLQHRGDTPQFAPEM
jgi:hypothetical protein